MNNNICKMNKSLRLTKTMKSFINRFLPDKCKQRVLRV